MDGAKVNKRVVEGLIQCGAFDFTGTGRAVLFDSLNSVLRSCGAQDPDQLSMFSNWSGNGATGQTFASSEVKEWDEVEKLRKEKEALGFYITGHPLDRFKQEIERFATCNILNLSNLKDKSSVKLAGVIGTLKLKRTKKGDKMAILNFEDQTGSVEVVVFPEVFNSCSPLLKSEEPLLIQGTAEVDENMAKIISNEISSLEDIKQKAVKAIEITLKCEWISKDRLKEIRNVLFRYQGESSLRFRVYVGGDESVLIKAHANYRISPCKEMIREIEAITLEKVTCHYGEKNSHDRNPENPQFSRQSG
jgi:DNA polymerase-3 subunit alpha